jgi:hypothetical protein
MVRWRKQLDSSGAPNGVAAASKTIRIKKSTGAWGTDDIVAITFADNSLMTAANGNEPGIWIVGSTDLQSEVDDIDNATYNIRSEETNSGEGIIVDGASLTLYDVFTGLRVHYNLQ